MRRTLTTLTFALGAYLAGTSLAGLHADRPAVDAPAALVPCASTITTRDAVTGAVLSRTCDPAGPVVEIGTAAVEIRTVLLPAVVCDPVCHER